MADKKTSAKKSAGESKTIQIEYYRSAICTPDKHRKVIKGLGFTRLRQVVDARRYAFGARHGEGDTAPGAHSRLSIEITIRVSCILAGRRISAGELRDRDHEFIKLTGTEKSELRQEADWPRYGIGHGQDFHPRPQGAGLAVGFEPDARI